MNVFLYTLLFIIGTLFGSFFTLAIYRIPLKKDITHEHSFCPNCNHKLSFLDLIPVLSYICLGGKCRYCKQKIRPRYLLLEILSGITFVLFAMSIGLNIYNISSKIIVYLVFSYIYIAILFIIAGIDNEKRYIEKPVLLFGYIVETLYIIYLYIVEKDPNIYRYVIYLICIVILLTVHTIILRKKIKNSYPIDVLLLCMLFITFTSESVTILTITFAITAIAIWLIIKKIMNIKNKKKAKRLKENNKPIPIGFYLCVTNIICFIIVNYYIFTNL